MQRLKEILVTSPQWDQSRKWAALLFFAFMSKYAYVLFPEGNYSKPETLTQFFPWVDWVEVPKMDWRNYVYLIGERVFIMILFFIISQLMYCWQTVLVWLLVTLYIFDFIGTFHSTKYGSVMVGIIGLLFISKIIPWNRLYSKIFGNLFSSSR